MTNMVTVGGGGQAVFTSTTNVVTGAGSETISAATGIAVSVTGSSVGTIFIVGGTGDAGSFTVDPNGQNVFVQAGIGATTVLGTGDSQAANTGSDTVLSGIGFFHAGSGGNSVLVSAPSISSANRTVLEGGGTGDILDAQSAGVSLLGAAGTYLLSAANLTIAGGVASAGGALPTVPAPAGLAETLGGAPAGVTLNAGRSNAIIFGAPSGANTIISGSGSSTVWGHSGATSGTGNTYLNGTAGQMTIEDFNATDVLKLNGGSVVSSVVATGTGSVMTLSDGTVFTFANISVTYIGGVVFASGSAAPSGKSSATVPAGQSLDLDSTIDSQPTSITSLQIEGPGTAELSGPISIGTLEVASGGQLVLQGATIGGGADTFLVDPGATVEGSGTITSTVVAGDTLEASGGTLDLTGQVGGTAVEIGATGVLQVEGTVDAPIVFTGTGETLILGPVSDVAGLVEDFVPGDQILLEGAAAGSATYSPLYGELTIIGSDGSTHDVALRDDYAGGQFAVSNGAVVVNPPPAVTVGAGLGKPFVIFDADGEVWVTDGTGAGTAPLDPSGLTSAVVAVSLGSLELFDGISRFTGLGELTATGGTDASTVALPPYPANVGADVYDLVSFGSLAVYAFDDSSVGLNQDSSLYATDGTVIGTEAVPGQNGSNDPSNLSDLTVFGNEVLFAADNGNLLSGYHGNVETLWETNGTVAAPLDISNTATLGNGVSGLTPTDLTVLGNKALFSGIDAADQTNLWITDGTGADTSELSVAGAAASLDPTDLTVVGSTLFFAGTDTNGDTGVWVSDGTAPGTRELVAGRTASTTSLPTGLTAFNGKLFFGWGGTGTASNLWMSDGTPAGTSQMSVAGAAASLAPADLTVSGSKLLFAGTDTNGQVDLWVSDGTANGTTEVNAANAGPTGLHPADMTVLGNEVLFNGVDSKGANQLWSTDGTAADTVELNVPGAPGSLNPTYLSAATVPCFRRGTRILTARGEVAVEKLSVGDDVLTEAGAVVPVRWIGHRRIACARHPSPERIWPVRVAAGAFAPGMPRRDLCLSPDHAVFVDGVLIPIKHLINGRSISQERVATVEYWHVELDRHEILHAEGLPCESYLDTGNRASFENGGCQIDLHPDFSRRSWDAACAELVQDGPLLVAIKERLFMAAGEPADRLGLAVQVFAEGKALAGEITAPGTCRYMVPAGIRSLHLVSPAWMPAARVAASLDRRRLGIRLLAVAVDGEQIDLASPVLSSGFHPLETTAEGPCRWTDGGARLELPSLAASIILRAGDGAAFWNRPAASTVGHPV